MGIMISLFLAYVGQVFFGAGIALLLSSQLRFCFNWIEPEIRPKYFVMLSMAYMIGISLSRFYPLLIIDDSITDILLAQDNIMFFNMSILFFNILTFIFSYFLFRGVPPPQYGWSVNFSDNQDTFLKHIWVICSSKKFQLYCALYAVTSLFNYTLMNALPVILKEVGYSDQGDMICFTVGIITGVIGASIYINKYIHMNNSLHLPGFIGLGISFYCCFVINLIYSGPEWLLYLLYGAFSFFLMVIQPLIFELTVRTIYPSELNFINNIYFIVGSFSALLGILFKEVIFKVFQNQRDANFLTECMFLLQLLIIFVLSVKVK